MNNNNRIKQDSVEFAVIDNYSIRFTPCNRLFIVDPFGHVHFTYTDPFGGASFSPPTLGVPDSVRAKVADILARQEELHDKVVKSGELDDPITSDVWEDVYRDRGPEADYDVEVVATVLN